MASWWHRDVIAAGKLPLMLCSLIVAYHSSRRGQSPGLGRLTPERIRGGAPERDTIPRPPVGGGMVGEMPGARLAE